MLFGVKTPLRHAIIQQDRSFRNSMEIKEFLTSKFADDDNKYYYVLEKEQFSDQRNSLPIIGSSKLHTIVYQPNGTILCNEYICSCEQCIEGNLLQCTDLQYSDKKLKKAKQCNMKGKTVLVSAEDLLDNENDTNGELEANDLEENEVVFDEQSFIPGSVIAVYSDSGARELFYLCKVGAPKVASTDVTDVYGHTILEKEQYIQCQYLELTDQMPKRGYFYYKELKKPVYIKIIQIFCPMVNMDNTFYFYKYE